VDSGLKVKDINMTLAEELQQLEDFILKFEKHREKEWIVFACCSLGMKLEYNGVGMYRVTVNKEVTFEGDSDVLASTTYLTALKKVKTL
jgi:hypothetical protein